jgi:hypothetical protein
MGYSHCVVVYYIRKIIGGHTIRFYKHLILNLRMVYGYVAENLIMEGGFTFGD